MTNCYPKSEETYFVQSYKCIRVGKKQPSSDIRCGLHNVNSVTVLCKRMLASVMIISIVNGKVDTKKVIPRITRKSNLTDLTKYNRTCMQERKVPHLCTWSWCTFKHICHLYIYIFRNPKRQHCRHSPTYISNYFTDPVVRRLIVIFSHVVFMT